MYKRILFILFIVLSVFIFTACVHGQPEVLIPFESRSDDPADNDPRNDDPFFTDPDTGGPGTTGSNTENGKPLVPTVFSFKMGDVLIEMDQDITYVIERAGEPTGIFEAPSCAFDGIDRIFAYPGVQIYTYPDGDNDLIHTIAFFDDTIRTTEGGLRLGSGLQAVFDTYGDDYIFDSGMYTFNRGLTRLEFLVEDDIVIGISYGLHLDL